MGQPPPGPHVAEEKVGAANKGNGKECRREREKQILSTEVIITTL